MKHEWLEVFHAKELKRRGNGLKSLLRSFEKTGALPLSTCARNVWLMSAEQKIVDKWYSQLSSKCSQTKQQIDRYSGFNAYTFLLYWHVGGLAHDCVRYRDVRIIGASRKTWRQYEENSKIIGSKPYKFGWIKTYNLLMQALFKDVKALSKCITKAHKKGSHKEKDFKAACSRCANLRLSGFLDIVKFDYSCFLLEKKEYLASIDKSLIATKDRLKTNLRRIDKNSEAGIKLTEKLKKVGQFKLKLEVFYTKNPSLQSKKV